MDNIYTKPHDNVAGLEPYVCLWSLSGVVTDAMRIIGFR